MKTIFLFTGVFVYLLLGIGYEGFGQLKYEPAKLVLFDSSFKTGTLRNGIRYMIRSSDVDKGKAYFYAFFNIGAIHEEPNEYGAAHFIEHLLAEYAESIDTFNCKYVDLVATTSHECTQYAIFDIPTQQENMLDSALNILKIVPFNRVFENNSVEKERKIIFEEWRLDQQRALASDRIESHVNPIVFKGSRYSRPETIGDTAVINHISRAGLQRFYDKWYRPEFLTVIAIGDFDANKMKAKIERIFSPIPKAKGPSPKIDNNIPEAKYPTVIIDCDSKLQSGDIELYYKQNKAIRCSQKTLRTELIDRIIADMFQNRLDRITHNLNPLFVKANAFYHSDYFGTSAASEYVLEATAFNNDVKTALSGLMTEKERIEKYGFTKTEYQRTQKMILDGYKEAKGRKSILPYDEFFLKCYAYILYGKASPSYDYLCDFATMVIPGITLEEVNARFKEYTANKQPVIMVRCPRKEGITIPSVSDVKEIMASIQTREIKPHIDQFTRKKLFDKEVHPGRVIKQVENHELGTTEWTLSNGMRVIIKSTNFKSDEIQFRGLKNKSLTSFNKKYFYTAFLGGRILSDMGLGNFTSTQLQQLLVGKNVSVEPSFFPVEIDARATEQFIKGSSDPRDFETCLQLIHLNFCNQRWDATVFANKIDLLRDQMGARSPKQAIADSVNFYSSPKQIKNGKKELTFKENLDLISLEKLKKIHEVVFGDPASITFFFSGNLKPGKVKPLIEKYLGGLTSDGSIENGNDIMDTASINDSSNDCWKPGKKSYTFKYPMQTPAALVCIKLIGKHDGKPSDFLYGQMTRSLLRNECHDYVREKNEATYSIWSDISVGRTDLSLYFQTGTAVGEKTRKGAVEDIKNFILTGPSESSFYSLKTRIMQKREDDLRSNRWWVDSALYEYYFHGKNIVPTYDQEIKNITKKDLTLFIQNVYNQGNSIVDALMLPK